MAQIFYDKLLATSKIIEINSEHPVETEILLADYDQPVFKIVKTVTEHTVTQKYIMQGRLTVEGFVKISVYYQPPETAQLAAVSQKLPFQKQVELPKGDYDVTLVNVSGQSQYINTRPQNSTRIEVRGAYLFGIKVFARQNTNIITAVKGDGVCCDTAELPHFCLAGQNTRRFTVENEVNVPENFGKILRVQYSPASVAVGVYEDKMTAKGSVDLVFFYTETDSGKVKSFTQSFPYNQIIDVPGIKENHICAADVSLSSLNITQNSDSGKYIANLTAMIDGTAFCKQQVIAVKDGFSRRYHSEKTGQELLYDTNMYQVDKSFAVTLADSLPAGVRICDIIAETSPVKSYFEINKTAVKAKVTAHIITVNSQNEYECFTKTEDINLDLPQPCGQYDEICIKISPTGCSYSAGKDSLQVNITLAAQGFVIEKMPVSLLKSFEEDTENPVLESDGALIVYYGEKGERIFDIAQAHNADPEQIRLENDLDGKALDKKRMIFISTFAQ